MRFLGLDPGSATTGYGVVDRVGADIVHVAHGTIRVGTTDPLPERLARIQHQLRRVLDEHAPERAVVERVFVAANPHSALVLGHARGVILAVLGAAGIAVDELAAREIKKAIVGTGRADKSQIQSMVRRLLDLPAPPPQDAADALAAAMCRAQMGRLAGLGLGTRSRRSRLLGVSTPGGGR